MKICSNCILPDTFPGINFNTGNVCNICNKYEVRKKNIANEKKKYEQKFLDLFVNLDKPAGRSYDVVMAYSGGKDSTYTMSLFKRKYNLRVLAVSLDNGFISGTSHQNINDVTDKLGIDHVMFKPQWDMLRRIFGYAATEELYSKKTLERASTICTSCIGLVKSICLKTAIEQNIPIIGLGWSPGQAPVQSSIMKNNPALIKMTQKAIKEPLRKVVGDEIDIYFLNEWHYSQFDRFPYNVHPMAWEPYNEHMIIEEIKKLGWMDPKDTDANSSNCLLNAYANEIHIDKYGFHPYVWEIANMVREGIMTREEGFNKIYQGQPSELVEIARKKLKNTSSSGD
jgi:predicted PP-loop superfamily ATPase